MDKTAQTMVGETDTVFFAAVIVVPVVRKSVFIPQEMLSIPETIVFSNEKIFLTTGTIFPVNQKMVLGFAILVFVPHTKDSDTRTMAPDTKTRVGTTKTMVEADC